MVGAMIKALNREQTAANLDALSKSDVLGLQNLYFEELKVHLNQSGSQALAKPCRSSLTMPRRTTTLVPRCRAKAAWTRPSRVSTGQCRSSLAMLRRITILALRSRTNIARKRPLQLGKALQLKPDYLDAFNSLGLLLQDQGRYEAIGSFSKACKSVLISLKRIAILVSPCRPRAAWMRLLQA